MTSVFRIAVRGLRGLSKAALNREPVDEATLRGRRRVCAACPSATRTRRLGVHPLNVLTPASACAVCRCNLHAKTRLAGEACPHGHWLAAAPADHPADHLPDNPDNPAPRRRTPLLHPR